MQVKLQIVGGPRWDDCGVFVWRVKFLVTDAPAPPAVPKAPGAPSWLVQEVVSTYRVFDCAGKPTENYDKTYYEAFAIDRDGASMADFSLNGVPYLGGPSDNFERGPYKQQYGSWTIDAKLFWLPRPPTDMGNHLIEVPEAGDLPSSLTKPASVNPNNWSIRRHVEARWDCCGEGEFDERQSRPGYTFLGHALQTDKSGAAQEVWVSWRPGEAKHMAAGL